MTKKTLILLALMMVAAVMLAACSTPTALPPTQKPASPVDVIVGDWTGNMYLPDGGDSLGELNISIQAGCEVDKVCGSYAIPFIPCSGTFTYRGASGETFKFEQQLTQGDVKVCGTGSMNSLTPNQDGTLAQTWTDGTNRTKATLTRK